MDLNATLIFNPIWGGVGIETFMKYKSKMTFLKLYYFLSGNGRAKL